jgi:hypothetical protein
LHSCALAGHFPIIPEWSPVKNVKRPYNICAKRTLIKARALSFKLEFQIVMQKKRNGTTLALKSIPGQSDTITSIVDQESGRVSEEWAMLKGKELICGLERFGRWNVQGFVMRSRNTNDVLTYLQAERIFELFSATSYSTKDSIHFEKRTGIPFIADHHHADPPPASDAFESQFHESDSDECGEGR